MPCFDLCGFIQCPTNSTMCIIATYNVDQKLLIDHLLRGVRTITCILISGPNFSLWPHKVVGLFITICVVSTLVSEIQYTENNVLDLSSFPLQIGSYWILKLIFIVFGKVWQQPHKMLDTESGDQ